MKVRLSYFWITISIFCFGLPARSQLMIGLQAGPDVNSLKTNIVNIPVAKCVSVTGVQAGLLLQYKVNSFLAVGIEPSFQEKGYKLEWTGYFSGIYQTNLNDYLSLPLTADFSFVIGKFRLTVPFGGYAAYWSGGRVKGNMPNILDPTPQTTNNNNYLTYNTPYSYDVAYSFDQTRDDRVELGWVAGARAAYDYRAWQFFLGAEYYQSVTDEQKAYETGEIPRYNRTFQISAGFLRRLNAPKIK
jgi:Outer membrane protein beta-barrel domain